MAAHDKGRRSPWSDSFEELETPFLDLELIIGQIEEERAPNLGALESESPFMRAFEQGRTSLDEGGDPEVEFVEEYQDGESEDGLFSLDEEECDPESEDEHYYSRFLESEASSTAQVIFPSGESLSVVSGFPQGVGEDYWDPTLSGNPLLDTGSLHKKEKLSPNFTVGELVTSGGVSADVARIDPKLVEALQRLREYVGKAITITSGYRSWKRNKAIYAQRGKKATHSQHCAGRAADIKIKGMNGLEIAKAAIDACGPNIGVGLGNTFAHIDVRGIAVAWNYGGVSNDWVTEIKRYQRTKAGVRTSSASAQKPVKSPARIVQSQSSPSTPIGYLGGKLWVFVANTLPIQLAVFVPQAALKLGEVEMLFYAHGLLDPCPGPGNSPDGIITRKPFRLGDIVATSGRPVVLVVPHLDWSRPGGSGAFGKDHPKWHALAKPSNLNSVITESLSEVGRIQGIPAPSLRNLIIAGHSRAYDFLEPLAFSHSDSQIKQGALARLSEVWAFDTTYGRRDIRVWTNWLAINNRLKVTVIYNPGNRPKDNEGNPKKSTTWYRGDMFYQRRRGNLKVERVSDGHCAMPTARLPTLLNPAAAASGAFVAPPPEFEFEEEHEEWLEGEEDEGETWLKEADSDSSYAKDAHEHYLEDLRANGDEAFAAGDDWSEAAAEAEDYGYAEALEFETESPWSYGSGTDSGWAAEGELFEGPEAALLNEYLQYLGELVDEEVFDEEVSSAEQEWQAYPTIHGHFDGKTPQQRFTLYLELRPLYQQATGAINTAKWITDNIVSLTFFGHRTPAHRDLRTPLAAAEQELQRRGVRPALTSFWGFVPRKMRRRNRLSNHALGRAVDIDPKTNPHIYNKDEILVIREATGIDLGKRQAHDAMRRASQAFRQTFSPGWVDQQAKAVQDAARRSRTALERYARDGFLNLDQVLIDTLLNAGFTWGGDWKSEKDFMHFELPAGRRPAPAADSTATHRVGATAGATAEQVRFAQRVLNAAEGERLAVDGNLGPLTRGALERFRTRYNLGLGGVLDEMTQLALVQRVLEELRQQSIFPQLGVLDATTRQELGIFKSRRGLGTDATIDKSTRAALADALGQRTVSQSSTVLTANPQLAKIVQVAAQSAIARYHWRDRGVAPSGYIKGMALVYARVYCKFKAGDPAAIEMAKANTGNTGKDALAHYAQEFRAAGMDNSVAGVDTLRHLYVLLIGLGMRESSGHHCAGRDRSANNITADAAEAGLFQASFNLRTASSVLPVLFSQYSTNPSGFREVFQEGARCGKADLENFGDGDGREFQRLSKICPAFAAEYAAVGLRNRRQLWGPINRKTAEIRPECDVMLKQVQELVDEYDLCPLVR